MTGRCSLSRGVVWGVALAWVLPSAAAPFMVVDWGGNYVAGNVSLQRTVQTENQTANYGGTAVNDSRKYLPFSDASLLSPASGYSGTSANFYGGWSSISYDVVQSSLYPASANRITDFTSMDGINFNAGKGGGRATAVAVWRKADFLSGSGSTLVLTASCTLRINIYDTGPGTYRLVVKNGSQYYISNTSSTSTGWLTVAAPTSETWATFNPANANYLMEEIGASYTTRIFDDVQAIGYYWTTTSSGANTYTAQVKDVEFMAATPAAKGTVISVF